MAPRLVGQQTAAHLRVVFQDTQIWKRSLKLETETNLKLCRGENI